MEQKQSRRCDTCNNEFLTRQSLWNHKQRCKRVPSIRKIDVVQSINPDNPVGPPELSVTISSPSPQLSLAISECMKPISFGELWCKEGQKEDEEDEDEDEEEKDEVKFLPTTREGLQKRFNELFYEFTRQKKKRNRNELVFLLDEMLRKNFITPLEFQSLNNILAESLGSGIQQEEGEEMEVEPTIKDLIKSTIDYLTEDAKKEISSLVKELEATGEEKDYS